MLQLFECELVLEYKLILTRYGLPVPRRVLLLQLLLLRGRRRAGGQAVQHLPDVEFPHGLGGVPRSPGGEMRNWARKKLHLLPKVTWLLMHHLNSEKDWLPQGEIKYIVSQGIKWLESQGQVKCMGVTILLAQSIPQVPPGWKKYSRNTSTRGTAPTEHPLNAGRKRPTSKKARNSPRTWVEQKKKEITETKE